MNEVEKEIKLTVKVLIILLNISISMGLIFIVGLIFNKSNHIFGTMYYLLIPMIIFLIIIYIGNYLLLKEIKNYQIIKNKN